MPSHAKKDYGLGSRALSSLPKFCILPGVYSLNETQHRCRRVWFDGTATERARIASHGSLADCEDKSKKRWQKQLQQYLLDSQSNPELRRPKRLEAYLAEDRGGSNPRRFMAVICVPWLDCSNGNTERGLLCKGCARGSWPTDPIIVALEIGGGFTATMTS